MTHDDQHTIQTIANAGADAVARWKASKRAKRAINYRQRMQPKEGNLSEVPPDWLAAVERDDWTDAVSDISADLPKHLNIAEQVTV